MSQVQMVVARFLDDARVRGEGWISTTRLIIALLAILRTVVFGYDKMVAGSAREWVVVGVCMLSAVHSIVMINLVRRGKFAPRALWTSIVADAVPMYTAVLTETLHPLPGYAGILRSPELGFFLLALCATALRFTPRLVIFGATVYFLMVGSLVVIDAPRMQVELATTMATACIVFLAMGIISWALARRVERLVQDGASAAVNAERARQHLGAYISTELAARVADRDDLDLVGEQRDVAVLFSDLRGFTSYAEKLAPARLVEELNAYLNAMLPIIHAEGGVVDKYIGDSIMVVFGIPESKPDDAARAIRAARGMQRALVRHNAQRNSAGLPSLAHGIGIHAGSVVAGNIGTRERLQYTVVGDVVNLASRLESATKEYGVPVLVSAAAMEAARRAGGGMPEMRPLGSVTLRGRVAPIEVLTFVDDGVSIETKAS